MTESPIPERAAYSIDEARVLLGGCSRSHIGNLAKRGELHLVRLGHRVLVPASEIDRLVGAPATGSTNETRTIV